MKKLKIPKQYEDAIQVAVLAIIAIAFFVVNYLGIWNFLEKPLNEDQFKMCEKVAHYVYSQAGQVIFEVPEGFDVDITTTTISVELAGINMRGEVVASLQNGELVTKRYLKTGVAIFNSILFAFSITCLDVRLIWALIEKMVKKRRQKKSNSEKGEMKKMVS